MDRKSFLSNLRSIIGSPYRWGAWGPDLFDCSGTVSFCLGLSSKRDAAELFSDYKGLAVPFAQAAPGCLVFYGTDINHIDHVMSVLEHWDNGYIVLAGACHGDSSTISLDRAKEQGACICTQPQEYWFSHRVTCVDPFSTIS